MSDLFSDQLTEEEKWAVEIQACRDKVEERVMHALSLGRSKAKRKELYQTWRLLYGDDIARESAKLVEAIINGKIEVPKWFRARRGR